MKELGLLGLSHILFGILLVSTKKRQRSDRVLLCWLVVLLMPFLQALLPETGRMALLAGRFVNQAFTLLHGPFLYLYIRELIATDGDRPTYWPHFVLFSVFYLVLACNPAPLHPGGPAETAASGSVLLLHYGTMTVLIFLAYGACSLRLLFKHRRQVRETFAYRNGSLTLVWLTLLPVLFVLLLGIIVLAEHSSVGNLVPIGNLHLAMFLFFALYLIFFGLRQREVYPVARRTPAEPKRPVLKEDEQDLLLGKIGRAMTEDRLYLDPTLSAYDLAKALGVSRQQVSALLNERLSTNFYQYVNGFRLEEVCRRLQEDTENRHNILELAMESGFNSKSSFNSLFKSRYGQTPSQYKRACQEKNGGKS